MNPIKKAATKSNYSPPALSPWAAAGDCMAGGIFA